MHAISVSPSADGVRKLEQRSTTRNGVAGVLINQSAAGNSVEFNNIDDNSGPGVWIASTGGVSNRVLANGLIGNAGLGIDVDGLGPTANVPYTSPPSGANDSQSYPVLFNAFRTGTVASGNEWIEGTLDSAPSTTFTLNVYFSPLQTCAPAVAPDPLDAGNAGIYLQNGTVKTDASGHVQFWLEYPSFAESGLFLRPGTISLTATNSQTLDTSEIGNCVLESNTDLIFRDGFGGVHYGVQSN